MDSLINLDDYKDINYSKEFEINIKPKLNLNLIANVEDYINMLTDHDILLSDFLILYKILFTKEDIDLQLLYFLFIIQQQDINIFCVNCNILIDFGILNDIWKFTGLILSLKLEEHRDYQNKVSHVKDSYINIYIITGPVLKKCLLSSSKKNNYHIYYKIINDAIDYYQIYKDKRKEIIIQTNSENIQFNEINEIINSLNINEQNVPIIDEKKYNDIENIIKYQSQEIIELKKIINSNDKKHMNSINSLLSLIRKLHHLPIKTE